MAGLILPRHAYQARKATKEATAAVETLRAKHEAAKADIDAVLEPRASDRVFAEIYDLNTEIPEGIPTPERFLLVIMPVDIRDRIGSIILPDKARDDQLWINGLGKVCAKGPGVYSGRRFSDIGLNPEDAPYIGDLVVYNAKSPNRIKVDGRTLIFVSDDAIMARVDPAHAHKIVF